MVTYFAVGWMWFTIIQDCFIPNNIIFCFYKIISMSLVLCLAALLLTFSITACPTDHLIPNLQVGSAFFSTSLKSKSNQIINATYEHTFTSILQASPAVALSLHSIGVEAILTEWALFVDEATPSKLSIGFKHRPKEWTMIKAGFWATTRNDLYVGSVWSNLNNLKQSTAYLYPPIKPNMANLNTSIMRAFLTGFTLKSGNQLFIRAFDKTINANKIEIGVQVGGSTEITFAVVNYLIFSPQTSSFASYGGGVSELGLLEGKLLNIQKIIHYSPYVFHGIANIRQSLQNPIMILTEVDSNFYLKIDTLAEFQQVFISYLVLGIAPAKVCSNCKQNFILGQQCVGSCPAGTYPIDYRNGGKGCRACPGDFNMIVNPNNNGCICQSGYIQKKGYCVLETRKTESFNGHFQYDGGVTNSGSIGQTISSESANKIVPASYTGFTPTTNRATNTNANSGTSNTIPSQIVPDNYQTVQNDNKYISSSTSTSSSTATTSVSTSTSVTSRTTTSISQPAIPSTPTTSSNLIKKVSNLTIRPTPASPQPESVNKLPETSSIATNLSNNPQLIDALRQEGLSSINTNPKPNIVVSASQKNPSAFIPPIRSVESTQAKVYPSPQIFDTSRKSSKPEVFPEDKNYYIPSPPARDSSNSLVQIISAAQPESLKTTEKDCSMLANTFWSGYKCTCKVSFIEDGGICRPMKNSSRPPARPSEFIKKISSLYGQKSVSCNENEVWNGVQCMCAEGCSRDQAGMCQRQGYQYNDKDHHTNSKAGPNEAICPPYSTRVYGQCLCSEGYVKVNNQCQLIECGQNSSIKEGVCICNSGYTSINNKCVKISQCGPYSSPDRLGKCQCDNGYKLYSNSCMKCPVSQIMIDGQCTYTCGVNEEFNPSINKCVCVQGYGLYQGVCRSCPPPFFIHAGYCVECPLRTKFDQNLESCVCQKMYEMVDGNCLNRCGQNEVYSLDTLSCTCLPGFYRVNKKCQFCQGSFNPFTQQCTTSNECKENQIKLGNNCVCRQGYGYSLSQTCMKCDNLPNAFLLDKYCVLCPFNTQNVNGKCSCLKGQRLVNGNCVNSCMPNQLMDEAGYCYYCPIGQEVVNGACVCQKEYERVNGICLMKCPASTVEINGACGTCVFGMEYDRIRKICACPGGYYATSRGGCEVYIPPPIACGESFYYSTTARKCQPCQPGCKSCTDQRTCSQCSLEGYQISAGRCVSKCGDGIMVGNEACDDGNTLSKDGCSSSCEIQSGSTCLGTRPSRCTLPQPICGDGVVNGNEQCDDRNNVRGDGCNRCQVEPGWKCVLNQCTRISQFLPPTPEPPVSSCPAGVNMKLVNDPIANQNNIFASVQTPFSFKFNSNTEMKEFMKYQFTEPGTQPSSAYCIQRLNNAKIYQCLIIYASGVPNKIFNINFSYKYAGESGQLCVTINPFNSFLKTRSLK